MSGQEPDGINWLLPPFRPVRDHARWRCCVPPETEESHVSLPAPGPGRSHRPASQVVRELMREFIERQRQAREYDAFLCAKVDTARAQIACGQVAGSADVEARFAARRAALRALRGAGRHRLDPGPGARRTPVAAHSMRKLRDLQRPDLTALDPWTA